MIGAPNVTPSAELRAIGWTAAVLTKLVVAVAPPHNISLLLCSFRFRPFSLEGVIMRFRSASVVLLSTVVLLPFASSSALAQTGGTWVCTARDNSRQAGFVSQLFNAADAARVNAAWSAAVKQYGVTPSTPPACQKFTKFAAADSARKQFIAFVSNSLEYRLDQMSWTYSGLPRATGDAPAAAASTQSAGASSTAQAEMSQAKAYCVQNHTGLYDCDAYAKAVADHRAAHPEEVITDIDGRRIVPIHDLETGIRYHLDCTICLNDEMLASWARQQVRYNFSAAVIAKAVTQAKVDAYADCVAKGYVAKMHARPNVEDYQKNFNEVSVACGSPH